MKSVYVLLMVALGPAAGISDTLEVPGDYATIQSAIDAASPGDTVLVSPGTYVELIDFLGKAITVQSTKGAAWTVIDGAHSGSVVTFERAESLDSVLKGFTITNGAAVFTPYATGGGIICRNASSPTIMNNVVVGNEAKYGGGGIGCEGSSAVIAYNEITDNDSKFGRGGGIYCSDASTPLIEYNRIANNRSKRGGGIYCTRCSPTIRNNIISGNYAGKSMSRGGGIFAGFSSLVIVNNIISGNSVECSMQCAEGGGISSYASTLVIVNNTIAGNSSGTVGGGMHFFPPCDVMVKNTIMWDNEAQGGNEIYCSEGTPTEMVVLSIAYSNLKGGLDSVYIGYSNTLIWGPNMMDYDPQFVAPVEDDYHIQAFSWSVRDRGDTSAVLEAVDFEGDPRITGDAVDIGADEFHRHLYYTGDSMPGGEVHVKFIGMPEASPVVLWLAFDVLDKPVETPVGDWYLVPPWLGPFWLPSIPTEGVLVLTGQLPAAPPGPYDLAMQAFIGDGLTNLSVLKVR